MKTLPKILFASILLTGVQFAFSGCETDGSVSGNVYYGQRRDPWFRDGPWMDGGDRRGYREEPRGHTDIYISPPRLPAPPRIHL